MPTRGSRMLLIGLRWHLIEIKVLVSGESRHSKIDNRSSILDSNGWWCMPYLVGGAICLVNSVNNETTAANVCDALRCSGPHARYTDVFNEYIALADRPGKSLKFHRDGDRSLQLLVLNEEFLDRRRRGRFAACDVARIPLTLNHLEEEMSKQGIRSEPAEGSLSHQQSRTTLVMKNSSNNPMLLSLDDAFDRRPHQAGLPAEFNISKAEKETYKDSLMRTGHKPLEGAPERVRARRAGPCCTTRRCLRVVLLWKAAPIGREANGAGDASRSDVETALSRSSPIRHGAVTGAIVRLPKARLLICPWRCVLDRGWQQARLSAWLRHLRAPAPALRHPIRPLETDGPRSRHVVRVNGDKPASARKLIGGIPLAWCTADRTLDLLRRAKDKSNRLVAGSPPKFPTGLAENRKRKRGGPGLRVYRVKAND
ncbi:hypothetical protein Tco_0700550 [Tanacetum coccineum]